MHRAQTSWVRYTCVRSFAGSQYREKPNREGTEPENTELGFPVLQRGSVHAYIGRQPILLKATYSTVRDSISG